MMTPISPAAHYAVGNYRNAGLARFVETHKGGARPDVGGYNHRAQSAHLQAFFLQGHRASESIQDKSQDARLSICHMPAYK